MIFPGLLVTFPRQACVQCGKSNRLHEAFMGLAKCVICGDISLEKDKADADFQFVG